MWAKHKKQTTGFTIVELLIVIVVIGILAAITVVAFNGVQERAMNTKTTQALSGWIKALTLYKADKGSWPSGWVCLGEGYSYGLNAEATGTGQCRQTNTSGYYVNTAFNNSMQPYIGGTIPSPAFVTTRLDDTNWRRGLMYAFGGGDGTVVYIDAAFAGNISSCPVVSGISASSRALWGSNTHCNYHIGRTSDT